MSTSADASILGELIRRIFAESRVFSGALVSPPQVGPEGEVMLEVGFGRHPPLLRVVAPTAQKAYAILHELAGAMVDIERRRHAQGSAPGECLGHAISP